MVKFDREVTRESLNSYTYIFKIGRDKYYVRKNQVSPIIDGVKDSIRSALRFVSGKKGLVRVLNIDDPKIIAKLSDLARLKGYEMENTPAKSGRGRSKREIKRNHPNSFPGIPLPYKRGEL